MNAFTFMLMWDEVDTSKTKAATNNEYFVGPMDSPHQKCHPIHRPGVQVRKQSLQVCLQTGIGASLNDVQA
jgi:hypothetical protein